MPRTIGVILLCLFLALYGLMAVSNFELLAAHVVLGCLALGAAIFIALGK